MSCHKFQKARKDKIRSKLSGDDTKTTFWTKAMSAECFLNSKH